MRRWRITAILLLLCLSAMTLGVRAEVEVSGDDYFTLYDEEGKEIFSTATSLSLGDIFINEDNRSYEVVAIDGKDVKARFLKIEELKKKETAISRLSNYLVAFFGKREERPIVIYHTHSDESYVPTSGTDSKYWGDVYQVGKVLKGEIERQGFKVIHAQENHNPHDGAAYERSRRTVVKYLGKNPVAYIDVHRDAVPPEVYRTVVNGQPVTKVTLIIGRQNQNKGANLEFAKSIKDHTDSNHPGLIRGILLASGNYNQDVGPRMLLVEMGAHTNSLEEAEKAAAYFATVVPSVVYGTTPSGVKGIGKEGQSAGRTGIWLIVIAVVVVGFYLAINSGALTGVLGNRGGSDGGEGGGN